MTRKATKTKKKSVKKSAKKSVRKASPSVIGQLRKEYGKVKRAYKGAGKAAFGKPANSAAKREYATIKRAYKTIGNKLGRATGIK
jgi:uncharacterized protein YukE